LRRWASYTSLALAVVMVALKTAAWLLTGAVALLDAAILAAVSVATANLERGHSGPPADEANQPGAEAEVAS